MKIAIILGTRPEIIKMSPIIREYEKRDIELIIIHTGQHYSKNMNSVFFEDLELPAPKYNLNVGMHTYNKQIGRMIKEIHDIIVEEKVNAIIVQGDTNSVLAGALAANKARVPIAHHEAGLRSHDLRMLEEVNRITTDHISDFLFAPTEDALRNIHKEGLPGYKTFFSGNTIVEAVRQNLEIAKDKVNILKKLNLEKKNYIVATAHRAENVDDKEILENILKGLFFVQRKMNIPIIYVIHPRAKKRIEEFKLQVPEGITLIDPLGYLEFLQLLANSKLVITDSGGLQEESYILKVPCVTIRESTERPETVRVGTNIVAGTNPEKILSSAREILQRNHCWRENIFGDGKTSEIIINTLMEKLK
jgi:UDP-N-acetylglucosamine 2-epimerase (non-hydrolysing)